MNFFNTDNKKLELIPDQSINIKDFYYYDSNDMLQFNSNFDRFFNEK
jgi:hypothetical protein